MIYLILSQAIILDIIMRLGWAILISPSQTYLQQHLVLLLGCVELLRRFMWSVFRVEWEWIKIKSKIRVTSCTPPVHSEVLDALADFGNGAEEDIVRSK